MKDSAPWSWLVSIYWRVQMNFTCKEQRGTVRTAICAQITYGGMEVRNHAFCIFSSLTFKIHRRPRNGKFKFVRHTNGKSQILRKFYVVNICLNMVSCASKVDFEHTYT